MSTTWTITLQPPKSRISKKPEVKVSVNVAHRYKKLRGFWHEIQHTNIHHTVHTRTDILQ